MFQAIRPSGQLSKCLRTYYGTRIASYSGQLTNQLWSNSHQIQQTCVPTLRYNLTPMWSKSRCYSTDKEPDPSADKPRSERKLPQFSDAFILIGINLYGIVKSTLLSFLVRARFEPDFSKVEFIRGSRRAIEVIFRKLANGQYDELNDLVEENLLNRLKQYFGKLSEEQRSKVQFDEDDIVFVNFNNMNIRKKGNRTHLCIDIGCVILHDIENVQGLPRMDKWISRLDEWTKSMEKQSPLVINCAFTKECTEGAASDWTVNDLNFMMLSDLMHD